MGSGFFRKKVVERYFLEREAPYTKRRPINTKAVGGVLGVLMVLFVVGVIFFGGEAEKKETARLDYSAQPVVSPIAQSGPGSLQATPYIEYGSNYSNSNRSKSFFRSAGGTSSRTRSASQVIRRGDGGNDPEVKLPMGYGISAILLNAIQSSDSSTPVIAEITQDVFPPGYGGNTASIPTGTKAIGNANYDENAQRIQIRFHTLVYPEGEQHSFQGIGLMDDGSAGLMGDYHSGETKRQVGSFIGNFAGGIAEGMKERTAGGKAGIPYEPGSIRNGILNGISQSASDMTKSYSEDLRQTKSSMSIPAGQSFIIFLDHEFTP